MALKLKCQKTPSLDFHFDNLHNKLCSVSCLDTLLCSSHEHREALFFLRTDFFYFVNALRSFSTKAGE